MGLQRLGGGVMSVAHHEIQHDGMFAQRDLEGPRANERDENAVHHQRDMRLPDHPEQMIVGKTICSLFKMMRQHEMFKIDIS